MATLTDKKIQSAKAKDKDLWLSDGGARGSGRLYLRIHTNGRKTFYYRCAGPNGERQSIPLGEYSQKSDRAGLSLNAARDKAGEYEAMRRSGIADLKGHLEAVSRARERGMREAEEIAKRAAEAARQGSLRNLLNGYTDHLERAGKIDAKDVKGIFRLHIFTPWPELCDRKASEIRSAELRQVIARLIDHKKGRTAGKLRSYIRAAYAAAIRAENDPTAPETLLGYGIEYNPADALPALTHLSTPGDRTLSDDELLCHLNGIEEYPLITRTALRVGLYLGGQRPTQLLRVKPSDVELIGENEGEIRLYDYKGARRTPRLHVLPLIGVARSGIAELLELNGKEEYLFCNVKGTHLNIGTMSNAVFDISEAMTLSGRSPIRYQQKDIRRTAETMMARAKVSKDMRAQLQSHGLGGVQNRHYDRYSYWDEKVTALKAWNDKLEAIRNGTSAASNVIDITRAA